MDIMPPDVLKSKLLGCFLGKNIGGTLGAPFEGRTEINDLTWYSKAPKGNPLPNDDLDLQLVWLSMVEFYGLDRLTPRLMGEYWISAITGPWGEYGNCRWNCMNGIFPPLSGACDNEKWKFSNGAWIRSEIWACLCAGRPDDAIRFAWLDACADHCGEGIYAEMFTTALEAAAFCCSDMDTLLKIALNKIPQECKVRKSVELVTSGFAAGKTWQAVREEVVAFNEDLGWFQAPANVAFTVIGLLYGQGDFGSTVCIAVNCGDDTDCTGASAGAIMGILYGAEAIPAKWRDPIGDGIETCAFNHFPLPIPAPKTVTELVERILRCRAIQIVKEPEMASPEPDFFTTKTAEYLWDRPSLAQEYDVSFATLTVKYPEGPFLTGGKAVPLDLEIRDCIPASCVVRFRWLLPEGWTTAPGELLLGCRNFSFTHIGCTITPPEVLTDAMYYLQLEITHEQHRGPIVVTVPFRHKGAVNLPACQGDTVSDNARRMLTVVGQVEQLSK